jgi:putative ABC transport system substrate-binding protein
MQLAASALKFDFHVLSASADQELEPAFETARRLGLSGIAVGTDAFFISRSKRLAMLALEHAIPTIFQFREFVAAGGLMSYGSDVTETYVCWAAMWCAS